MHIEERTKDRIKWAVSIISLGMLIYIFKTTWLPKLEDALSTTILDRGEMSVERRILSGAGDTVFEDIAA